MNQLLWGVYEKEPFFMTISNVYQLKIIRELLKLTGFFLNHQIGRLGFCVLLTKTSTTDTRASLFTDIIPSDYYISYLIS